VALLIFLGRFQSLTCREEVTVPKVVFLIGAGGSGKSTALSKSEWSHLPVVNSDTFIENHPDWVGNGGTLEAFQLHNWASAQMELEWEKRLKEGKSFALDGTGKTRSTLLNRIQAAKAAGFETILFWVYVPLETCLQRNTLRVRRVPEEVIREAWVKVKANFGSYREAADRVKVLINI
jgi:predicted kinase